MKELIDRIRQLLSDGVAAWSRLNPRERGLVALAAGAALLFVVVVSSLTISRSMNSREARIRTKMEHLAEVQKLTAGYRAAEASRNQLEGRLRGNQVRLASHVEELAKRHGIEVGGMNQKDPRPMGDSHIQETLVEVTFTRIELDKLVKFLTEVESGPGLVKVTRVQLRPRNDAPVLDAWLTVSTYKLEG